MIAKKNSRFDLERKRTALFAIGLLTAGSFTLAAFTYESATLVESDKERVTYQEINYMIQENPEEEKIEEPVIDNMEQDQPEASINALANPDENSEASENSNESVETTPGLDDLKLKFGDDVPDMNINMNMEIDIIDWADTEAEFVGGYNEMMKFIGENVEYPDDAIVTDEQGKVFLNFIVETDGSITNISIEKGVSKSLDREAKRIVRAFPKWVPAELNAKKVRTRVRLPIVFILE